MKRIVWLILLLFPFIAKSQEAYLYLEGIKGLPFTITVNNKEAECKGKNYCILTFKETGEQTIDIVFGANLFPKQTFVLDVVKGSYFSYKLAKTGEDRFYLLDLVNSGKIIEPNTMVNIGMATDNNYIHFYNPDIEVAIEKEDSKKKSNRKKRDENEEEVNATENVVSKSEKNNDSNNTEESNKFGVVKEYRDEDSQKQEKEQVTVSKNNCPQNAADSEVTSIIERMNQRGDDEARLILLKRKYFTGCINSVQAHRIVENFLSQYNKYAAAKFLRSNVSDIENMVSLQDLFTSNKYKNQIQKLAE